MAFPFFFHCCLFFLSFFSFLAGPSSPHFFLFSTKKCTARTNNNIILSLSRYFSFRSPFLKIFASSPLHFEKKRLLVITTSFCQQFWKMCGRANKRGVQGYIHSITFFCFSNYLTSSWDYSRQFGVGAPSCS